MILFVWARRLFVVGIVSGIYVPLIILGSILGGSAGHAFTRAKPVVALPAPESTTDPVVGALDGLSVASEVLKEAKTGTDGVFVSEATVYDRLRKNIHFWIKIYTQYDRTQGLIHDSKYIDHVYEVLDLKSSSRRNRRAIRQIKTRWKELLLSVHRKQSHPERFTPEEQRIFLLYQDIQDPNKFLNAAHRKRLRFQLGQKDQFLSGVYQSGRFLPQMEEIFRKQGVPVELTRLPFVESSFNIQARSKVGASGIWQFMRSTGRNFLTINHAVDERNDPIRATEAAAKLLKLNFDSLRNWPLAVTAYNHGRQGMMRAVQRVGSDDLSDLMDNYKSRSFGFASSNFFAEFMAVVEVERNLEKYFGKAPERAKPVDFIEFRMPHLIGIKKLSEKLDLRLGSIRELNPALNDSVMRGRLMLPIGYPVRVPQPQGMSREEATRYYQDKYRELPATGLRSANNTPS